MEDDSEREEYTYLWDGQWWFERRLGLRPANGMTAVHAYKRFAKGR